MARIVVDASVVVQWFLEEPHSNSARRLRDDYVADDIDLDAPAVLPFEVLNAVRFGAGFRAGELSRVVDMLGRFGIPLHHLEGPFAEVVADLTDTSRLTVYDASYMGLAKVLGVPVYTADEAMIRAKPEGVRVLHVREYPGAERVG